MDSHIEIVHFNRYIKPFLSNNNPHNGFLLSYFWKASSEGWRISIYKDLNKLNFVLKILDDLYQKYYAEFLEIVACIFNENHDSKTRINHADKVYYNTKVNREDVTEVLGSMTNLYKTFFESELRLYITPVYFYLARQGLVNTHTSNIGNYVRVSASEKFNNIKNVTSQIFDGSITQLLTGFDNQIRNSSGGHEHWEISDTNSIILKITNPKTGEIKSIKEFNKEEFTEKINECRRTIWILEMGLLIFIYNHPIILKELNLKDTYKIKEIRNTLENFAENRSLKLTKFNINESKDDLEFELIYTPKILGESNELLIYGQSIPYSKRTIEVTYKEQILGIIQVLLSFFDVKIPKTKLKVRNEKDELIMELEFQPNELKKLKLGNKPENIPIPEKGVYSNETYSMNYLVQTIF